MAGSGRTQKNKPHKTRFSSKAARREHKLSTKDGKIAGKNGPKQGVNVQTAKELRMQRTKNIRDHKRHMLLSEKRAIKGEKSPPRILALISLSAEVRTEELKQRILSACLSEEVSAVDGMETEDKSQSRSFATVGVPRHKLRLTVIESSQNDLQTCLQVAKVADIIAFVLPATCGNEEDHTDKFGKTCLSMLKAQGLPSTISILLGLSEVALKKRPDVKKTAIAHLEKELLPDIKVFTADSNDECQQILRYISEHRPSHLQWRSQRPFVMAEELNFEPDAESPNSGTLILSGYVREQSMSVNQLVHISGIGDFQLQEINEIDDPCPLREKHRQDTRSDAMSVDAKKTILPEPSQQEPLIIENAPDTLAGEQTWPTEEELAQAEKQNSSKGLKKRKLPKGTSVYQAAWIVDDSDDEGSDDDGGNSDAADMECENGDDNASVLSEEEGSHLGMSSRATSVWGDDAGASEMMDDESLSIAQKTAELQKLKEAHKDDEEFPDEVDTPMDVLARERFAKYRGLKSLRTSSWDPKESLPSDYARIFAFDNFNRTFKLVVDKARKVDTGSLVTIGSFVKLHIKGVSQKAAADIAESYRRCPVVACGLFQHESKMSVLHFSIKKHETFMDPIRSKDALVFHAGFRSYSTRPIFSTDDINMNKHKYERFLHPGRFSVASVFAPIVFPPAPLIVFKGDSGNLHFVASGSLRSVDPDRIILKKIILSGYPVRVSKRKAVVRYMFHNPEDVRWFKPLEVWTKYGRRGRIMEPVGTHGAMKCIFDGVVQQRDAVCINLYKRVYPKWPEYNI